MISVSNVSMRYGGKILFEEVSTTFQPLAAMDSPVPMVRASPRS